MAFDYTNLYPDTSANGGYTKSWNYTTVTDSIATCSASGYFNKVATRLGIGDNIIVSRVDAFETKNRTTLVEFAELFVTGISGGVVTTTNYTTGMATTAYVDSGDATVAANAAAATALKANSASPTFTGTMTYGGVTLSNSVTGTGSMVLSASPTLTTPNLGTPSAVTLTNATGLPIGTGVAGLGSGVATLLGTFSSANLAAALTDETGSGVVVFGTSPTIATPTIIGLVTHNQSAEVAGNGLRLYRSNGTTYTEMFMAATGIGIAANDAINLQSNSAGSTITALDRVGHFETKGGIRSSHATTGLGYNTGAGGTVTQSTNKSTGVTLNKACGQITMNNAALAASAIVSFTLTNSAIAATDVVVAKLVSGAATAGTYRVDTESAGSGTVVIVVQNVSAGSLSEAIVIQFAVVKAVAA